MVEVERNLWRSSAPSPAQAWELRAIYTEKYLYIFVLASDEATYMAIAFKLEKWVIRNESTWADYV